MKYYTITAYQIKDSDFWVECICTELELANKICKTFEESGTGGIRYEVHEVKIVTKWEEIHTTM